MKFAECTEFFSRREHIHLSAVGNEHKHTDRDTTWRKFVSLSLAVIALLSFSSKCPSAKCNKILWAALTLSRFLSSAAVRLHPFKQTDGQTDMQRVYNVCCSSWNCHPCLTSKGQEIRIFSFFFIKYIQQPCFFHNLLIGPWDKADVCSSIICMAQNETAAFPPYYLFKLPRSEQSVVCLQTCPKLFKLVLDAC